MLKVIIFHCTKIGIYSVAFTGGNRLLGISTEQFLPMHTVQAIENYSRKFNKIFKSEMLLLVSCKKYYNHSLCTSNKNRIVSESRNYCYHLPQINSKSLIFASVWYKRFFRASSVISSSKKIFRRYFLFRIRLNAT